MWQDHLTASVNYSMFFTFLDHTQYKVISEMATPIRPVIAPEPFTGEGSWDDWIDHFESVAAVNKWEDAQKLLWIRVRMTGRAQRAYKNLSEEAKGSYGLCKKGLRERFEPASNKELYQSEFHVRRKRRTEEWVVFAEDLKILPTTPVVTELTARCADLTGIGRTGVCRNYLRWREQSQYKLHFLYTLSNP